MEDLSKHFILLYIVAFLLGISSITLLRIVCKKEKSGYYDRVRDFNVAFFVYVLYSFSDYYRSFFFFEWHMNVFLMFSSNIITVVFLYYWYQLFQTLLNKEYLKKWLAILQIEGFVFLMTWSSVYVMFMDKEFNVAPYIGQVIAIIPDTVFYFSLLIVNIYLIFAVKREILNQSQRIYLLIVNATVLFYNCWSYLNDCALVMYPLGARIYELYPFNPIVIIYLLVNIWTIMYLNNNAFSWELEYQVKDVAVNISASPFEEICDRFNLTKRETEIIQLVYKGHSNPEISEILNITTGTVKRHIQNIFRKMEIKSRYELIHLIKSEQ